MARRLIAHFDLDAFFVSVECLLQPALQGIPLVVGGDSDRSVVAACSYEARKFGIHSAMPMKKAKSLCPGLTIIPGTRNAYSHYSRLVTEIIAADAPVFEKASIDEFYIDLTGMDRFFQPFEWTIALRQKIINKTGLPISFGMGTNKMIAKIATDAVKPNGYLFVQPGEENQFLDPMQASKIPGVGEQTFRQLLQLGIETIYELRTANPELLRKYLGKWGTELWQKANGIHNGVVAPYQEAKSVSTENTFEQDQRDLEFLMAELTRMTERIGYELRQDNQMAGCVTVKIRYPDFETTSRQASIPYTFYDDELLTQARLLFGQLYRKGEPVRLLGVRASELTGDALQTHLFEDRNRKSDLYRAIDDVKNKFGKSAIQKAGGRKS
ncbi:DNA polymerase IV [Flavihumibacter petaseus]|uniref:DNA polymerase IV n=1 Tax=Flavihumibacter petaseus NBRC 106054 TaxID=1220578 RepID=A0A0E9MWP4_9BACT|nr:DNA polymerase IV [Flavihumibacter petaseus]GAO41530.1 DNA polymerase IV [Flavihumibacter petaseus NBRC 106054]